MYYNPIRLQTQLFEMDFVELHLFTCVLTPVFAVLITFMLQQPSFALRAAGIAGQLAVGTDHAVTGNDDGNGVAAHGAADSTG